MKNIFYILGIQSFANHDSGASIICYDKKKNKVSYVAISEERLLRKKYPYTFPIHSINYCLEYFNLKNLDQIDYMIADWIRIKRWIRSGPSYNYQLYDYIKERLKYKNKIIQIDHHLAHAASVYYSSKFTESAILIVDGSGSDLETNSYFKGKKNKITLIDKSKYHGIGAAYTAVTKEILNFETGGEGKTMGLAPYGKKNNKIKIKYNLDNINTDFSEFMRRMPYSDVLNTLNSNFRPNPIKQKIIKSNKKNIMNKYFCDWAYAIQNVTEKVMVHLGKNLYSKYKSKNLCLAGGVALNSVANDKLINNTKFKELFVFPACSDSGIPLGLCLWGYHNLLKGKKRIKFENAYTGKNYENNEILKILKKNNFKFKKTNHKEIAKLIAQGKILGNFYGKSEYGPRALGNRSILADARNYKMRDYLNEKVKHREIFRPFAPAIIEKYSKEYFGINFSPFMLQVSMCKKSNLIPSSIHVDNTARVQTVNEKQNKNFLKIINKFYKLTKIPVILNTSFNDAGEPLVETPVDALICFLQTKIDVLVLNKFILIKDEQNQIKSKLNKLKKNRLIKLKKSEKNILSKITNNYSFIEAKKKESRENSIAKQYVLEIPIKKIKNFLKEYNKQNKPLLIIGTEDHTNILSKIFDFELSKTFFLDIKKNDIIDYKKNIHNFIKINLKFNFKKFYSKVLISSFEYAHEIPKKYNIKKYLIPYDNSSRSIIDYYYIKKFKGNKRILKYKIY